MPDTMRSCYTGYLLPPDGDQVYVMDGDTYAADHPLVVTHPQYFEPAETYEAHERVDVTTYDDGPDRVTLPGRPRRAQRRTQRPAE